MKVACISPYALTGYTIPLANALSSKGETVLLMLPQATPSEQIEAVDKGVSLYLFRQPRPRVSRYPPVNLLMVYDIIKGLNRFKPDIVHTQGTHFWLSPPLLPPGKYPLVSTFHDVKPHLGEERLSRRFSMYWARRRSKGIFVHGEKLRKTMIQEYGVPGDKVKAIPFGEHYTSPLKEYERADLTEDGNLVLFFGRIHEYKGLEYLIKAEPLITREVPDARIVIAGEGEDFQKYREMMVNKDNFIVYNYYVEPWKGAELFQRCSVVALPYIEASQSGVAIAGYGFKKPVVVTDVGSIPEIVDEGKTGFIVPPRNPEALAQAIITLLKDDKLRKQMGENAHRKLKTDLSWDRIAEITIGVYREAVIESCTSKRRGNAKG